MNVTTFGLCRLDGCDNGSRSEGKHHNIRDIWSCERGKVVTVDGRYVSGVTTILKKDLKVVMTTEFYDRVATTQLNNEALRRAQSDRGKEK